ncbi:MAG: MATE family efflux transporter [Clostridia bacterium]|nr:MATE family efflux transporter [Clostridia bacterium]
MEQNSKKAVFETMPVPKALATMAIPTIISQIINLIYNIVDAYFIGRTGNSYMMAATSLTLTIMMMTIAFSNLFGVGGGSLIARLLGQKKDGEAKAVSAFSIYGAVTISILYSLLIGLFLDPILRMLGASDATIGFAREYTILVIVIGCLPTILSATMAHLLRNVGYSKQAGFGLSLGGVLNIILDPLFMFVILPEGREVYGAALATLLSNVSSFCYLLFTVCRVSKAANLSVDPRDVFKIGKTNTKKLFSVGVPSAILTGLFDVANVVLNMLAAGHNDFVLAAIGIVMKIERLPNAVNIGLSQGMLPIVAYNYSSGNRERMKETIRTARIFGLSIAAACIVLFEIFANPLTSMFLNTAKDNAQEAIRTLAYAVIFLRLRCLAAPFQFINYHTSFCMQAMGKGFHTMLHATVRELVFYIPYMYLLNGLFGENGLAFALVAGEFCGAMFALYLLNRNLKKDQSLSMAV